MLNMSIQAKFAEPIEPQETRRPGRPTLSDDKLLSIALDLFLENGFERTSIDAIAAAAGMAKRTLYARHDDKVTLFKAALTRAIENWIVPVEQLRASECDGLEETLQKIGQILLANILSPAGLRLADLFRRRLLPATGDDGEADEAALAFLHLVVGGPASMAGWGVQSGSDAIEAHTRYCVRLFLYGTLAKQNGGAVEQENERLKAIIADVSHNLDRARNSLSGSMPNV
jgi:TetR/AcrR family transcriptional repressor of mexJK operon